MTLADGRVLAVALSPITNDQAVDALNGLALTDPDDVAEVVNIDNPDQPLTLDPELGWSVSDESAPLPAILFTWYGASALSQWFGGRLPTFVERTAIARLDFPDSLYPWGDREPTPDDANFAEHVGALSVPGSYPPLSNGVYDISGNVEEWCADTLFEARGGSVQVALDTRRLVTGGGWNKPSELLKVGVARHRAAHFGSVSIGWRPVFD
ncbi:SUMF1/EgtB/PvdO family nonheme iron enzyme [Gordonia sp. (in: high G+C Gram-positive bacteria)]|uniref:SUMF1/EgtB/PvdO family nonheme iron enzyme n=1 Tax=Gordonia sp. (in: high G+C Gram-positive bacteria) TaxID=84139 RepID=UPI003F98832D